MLTLLDSGFVVYIKSPVFLIGPTHSDCLVAYDIVLMSDWEVSGSQSLLSTSAEVPRHDHQPHYHQMSAERKYVQPEAEIVVVV